MKTLLLALVFASNAFADALDDLRVCQLKCSATCRDSVQKVRNIIQEVEDSCSSVAQPAPDIVSACTEGFTSPADETDCINNAKSASAVRTCLAQFTASSDELQCAKSAATADVITVCAQSFTTRIGGREQLDCVTKAVSAPVVTACKDGFTAVEDELACATTARSVNQIRDCQERHIAPADELRCIRSRQQ